MQFIYRICNIWCVSVCDSGLRFSNEDGTSFGDCNVHNSAKMLE